MYVLIFKNQYTILKNTYIRFEEYITLTKMNDNRWTLVDACLWTDETDRQNQANETGWMEFD
jgi:hypothetical protein